MNIIGEIKRQLQGTKDKLPLQDTTSDRAEILQLSTWEHTKTVHKIAKVAGKQSVRILSRSVAMVPVTGKRPVELTGRERANTVVSP